MKKLFMTFVVMSVLMLSASCSHFKENTLPKIKKGSADSLTKGIEWAGDCTHPEEIKIDAYAFFKIESEEGVLIKALNPIGPEGSQEESIISDLCLGASKLVIPAFINKAKQSGRIQRWGCQLIKLEKNAGVVGKYLCGVIPI